MRTGHTVGVNYMSCIKKTPFGNIGFSPPMVIQLEAHKPDFKPEVLIEFETRRARSIRYIYAHASLSKKTNSAVVLRKHC